MLFQFAYTDTLRSFRSKRGLKTFLVLRFFGLKTANFQNLKTVQSQKQNKDRFGQDQDQDLKNMVLIYWFGFGV